LALDLVDDPDLIQEYKTHHQSVWPQIEKSIRDSGIERMEIYSFSNRLFMILETNSDFSFEKKGRMDRENEKVKEWENLMWKYQKVIPGTPEGAKWVILEKILEID
jgi:L-rhamnose mutarotase